MNSTLTERLALIGKIDPVSQGAGTATTGLVPIKDFTRLLAKLAVGALGSSATVDAKLQGAVGSGGTPVDIPGAAITQLTQAGTDANKVAMINVNVDVLAGSGYTHARLLVTVATAACLIQADLWGGDARYDPASLLDLAAVDEIVNVG